MVRPGRAPHVLSPSMEHHSPPMRRDGHSPEHEMSPHRVSPQRVSPQRVSPHRVSPHRVSPHRVSPHGSPIQRQSPPCPIENDRVAMHPHPHEGRPLSPEQERYSDEMPPTPPTSHYDSMSNCIVGEPPSSPGASPSKVIPSDLAYRQDFVQQHSSQREQVAMQ